ncbi:hypothetical protein B0H17DRAFT_1102739, partial [Mycena rosella]
LANVGGTQLRADFVCNPSRATSYRVLLAPRHPPRHRRDRQLQRLGACVRLWSFLGTSTLYPRLRSNTIFATLHISYARFPVAPASSYADYGWAVQAVMRGQWAWCAGRASSPRSSRSCSRCTRPGSGCVKGFVYLARGRRSSATTSTTSSTSPSHSASLAAKDTPSAPRSPPTSTPTRAPSRATPAQPAPHALARHRVVVGPPRLAVDRAAGRAAAAAARGREHPHAESRARDAPDPAAREVSESLIAVLPGAGGVVGYVRGR